MSRYGYDELKIVFEVLDDEVVLIDLDRGHYYVLDGSAAAIWQLVAAGADLAETAEVLTLRHGGSREQIEPVVRQFVDELRREELLVPASAPGDATTLADLRRQLSAPCGAAFEAPAMYAYTDMANLIQMDPLQDFDPSGWPRRRTPPPPRRD